MALYLESNRIGESVNSELEKMHDYGSNQVLNRKGDIIEGYVGVIRPLFLFPIL